MNGVSLPQLSATDQTDVIATLRNQIAGEVRTTSHDRMLYATDASIYQVPPLGVVIPKHLDDVRAAVRFAGAHNIPILPRGGGTSLAGQTVNRALVLDFSRHCNAFENVDVDGRTATVEPGIVLDHLNAALAPHSLMFAPDVATASHANIGGMIGNNSAGAHSVLYGRTVEHLQALDVLLADGAELHLTAGQTQLDHRVGQKTRRIAQIVQSVAGDIRQRYPKITRRVNGYNMDMLLDQIERSQTQHFERVNLAHLLCGSEGTLGVTLRATVNLVPTPTCKGLAIGAFADVESALQQVGAILQTKPSAVELIDDVILNLAAQNNEYQRYVELLPKLNGKVPGAILYVEYFADDQAMLSAKFDSFQRLRSTPEMVIHTDPSAMAAAWKLRKAGEPLLYGMTGPRKPITFIEDAAVVPARLVDFVCAVRAMLHRHGTTASFYAHASVGCLHIRPMIALSDPADRMKMQHIAEETCDLVREFNGALSGEHGDGRLRSHLLERFYGSAICDAFARIKSVFDPNNLMNPGNITAPHSMTEQLRVRPDDHDACVPEVETFFKYASEGNFGEAVHMCNGAGVCRRTTGGTMCPSYRALHDERHATRGRGNALRLAITGQFNGNGQRSAPKWNDAETIRTLDLCMSCKACKAECPSNVDVARLKSEYMAQSYAAGRTIPLAAQLFSRVRQSNRLGSALHPIANLLLHSPLRAVADELLGLDARRSLPRYGPSLLRWQRRRARPEANRPVVLLFADCFSTYNEPHIGRAAVTVLETLGYRVECVDAGCCGRPAISLGLLGDALPQCSITADALIGLMQKHNAIALIGLEPSCVSAIVDDWQDLRLNVDQPRLRDMAGRMFAIEDFIESRWDHHPLRPELLTNESSSTAPVLLHGHCHQKALWGIDNTAALLQRCIGGPLDVLDSGCCGMAGAFGYMENHYDLSMAVGETALFPLVRAQPEAIVAAPGTSCRHQLHDALHIHARHPIELVADQLVNRCPA